MTEAGVAGGTSTIHHLAPVQMTLRGLHVAESATSAGPTRLGAGSATVPATRVETAVGDLDPGRRKARDGGAEHCERCALQLCQGGPRRSSVPLLQKREKGWEEKGWRVSAKSLAMRRRVKWFKG